MVDSFQYMLRGVPSQIVERMGRMSGLAYRIVLGYIDGEPETVLASIERVGTWDDDAGRPPWPRLRYEFAVKEALLLLDMALEGIKEAHSVVVPNEEIAAGAIRLIEQHGPATHREAAIAVLRSLPAGPAPMSLNEGEAGPVELAVASAAAAAMYIDPRYVPTPQAMRLVLVRQMREVEGHAIGAPDREHVTDVTDDAALAFLAQLSDDNYARLIPRSPSQRGPWEWDILAVLKAHLMETPAEATTPEQAVALQEQLLTILQAAAATLRPSAPAEGCLYLSHGC
ncbi:hypothetical protein ACWGCW_39065 [Streptomyces sp. NPDC054933]